MGNLNSCLVCTEEYAAFRVPGSWTGGMDVCDRVLREITAQVSQEYILDCSYHAHVYVCVHHVMLMQFCYKNVQI